MSTSAGSLFEGSRHPLGEKGLLVAGGISLLLHLCALVLFRAGGTAPDESPPLLYTLELRRIDLSPAPVPPPATKPLPPPAPPAARAPERVAPRPAPPRPSRAPEKPPERTQPPHVRREAPAPPPVAGSLQQEPTTPVVEDLSPAPAAAPATPANDVRTEPPPSAPAPGKAPATPAGAAEAQVGVRERYLETLKRILEQNREYPLIARRGRMEGAVTVRARLSRHGRVLEAKVESSSGMAILDRSALRSVRQVRDFPPVPEEISGEEIDLSIPVVYRLSP